jgi:3-dehydroquinate synthase
MSKINSQKIQVKLKDTSYPIWIKRNIIQHLDEYLTKFNNGQRWFLLTPLSIYNLYGKEIVDDLNQHNYNISPILIEDGETVKSIYYFEKYCKELVQKGCNRDSTLIAFGGGVTGDLTGFIASSIFRGIQYIQFPTSLLAMVDSSIGGKTGINIAEGKNLIGAFHHPLAILIDPYFLSTLPQREIISGLGEILKYGIIIDNSIIDLFIKFKSNQMDLTSSEIDKMIILSVRVKTDIVEKDVNESDLRRILNFGHTVGHIIEAYTNYQYISHGEAVLHGMIIAIELSKQICNLDKNYANKIISILKEIIIVKLPEISENDFNKFMFRDKKVLKNKLNFILLDKPCHPMIINDISSENIYKIYKLHQRSLI